MDPEPIITPPIVEPVTTPEPIVPVGELGAGNTVPAPLQFNQGVLTIALSSLKAMKDLPSKLMGLIPDLKEVRKLTTKDANDEFNLHNSFIYVFEPFAVAVRQDGKGVLVTRDLSSMQSLIGSRYSNVLLKDAADVFARSQEPPLVKKLKGEALGLLDIVKPIAEEISEAALVSESGLETWLTTKQTATT